MTWQRKSGAEIGLTLLIVLAMVCSMFLFTGKPAYAKTVKPGKIKASTVMRTDASETNMTVSFGKSANANKYQVQYKQAGAKKWKSVKTAKQSAVLKNLKKYTKYSVRVRGLRGRKKGAWTKAKSFTTLGDVHTLTYDPGVSGTLSDDQKTKQIRAGEEIGAAPWPVIIVDGQEVTAWFTIWFTEPYGEGKQIHDFNLMGNEDLTLYAAYQYQNGDEYPVKGTAIRSKTSKLYMRIIDYPRAEEHPSYALVTVLGNESDKKISGYLYTDHPVYDGGPYSPYHMLVPRYYNSRTEGAMAAYKLPSAVRKGLLDKTIGKDSHEYRKYFEPEFDVYLYAPASDPNYYMGKAEYQIDDIIALSGGATLQKDLSEKIDRYHYDNLINPLSLSEALKFTGGKMTGKKMKMLFNLKDDFDDSTNWCFRTPVYAPYALKNDVSDFVNTDRMMTYQSSTDSIQTLGLDQSGNVFARPSFVVDLDSFKFFVIDGQ